MSIDINSNVPDLDFDSPAALRHRQRRAFKDKLATGGIAVGGVSVILAVLMIFFYLLYEVVPLFQSASVEKWQQQGVEVADYKVPGSGKTLYLAIEEQVEVAMRVNDAGEVIFFNSLTGEIISTESPAANIDAQVTSFALISEADQLFALGFSNGEALVFKHNYKVSYPDQKRLITPVLEYPLGEEPLEVTLGSVEVLAVSNDEEYWSIVAGNRDILVQTDIELAVNEITEEVEIETTSRALPNFNIDAQELLLIPGGKWLMVAGNQGKIGVIDLKAEGGPQAVQIADTHYKNISVFQLLLGGNALLVGSDSGEVSQWFLVRDDENQWQLMNIRQFQGGNSAVQSLAIEHRRKGFATVDSDGTLRLFNTTAERNALTLPLTKGGLEALAYAPRSNALLTEQAGNLSLWKVHNEHPDVSWSALWEEVWYEGYQEPDYIWQSSAANNDFEPKYSLMPLAFGTLKAAFYAMLLAMPLAICGAIYTAYFMAPAMRRKVKPFIELMEALPTVILGFLAGLWLAPFMESNLAAIFVTLLMIPLAILLFGFSWANVPNKVRFLIPEGWDAILLVPVVILATLFALGIADPIEGALFGGDMRTWVSDELGIPFDQRNALVVGIAMGFAVIPTIFSITEDAIFAVPKHLSYGSLALGATPWQTLTRVVLPTASPGIFSAVMIGMGRAVGETMIVLMATGNTPIMDINIFEGMRTLAANIAVEMPESEVGSTHYRILFLAAFVLFLFTFVVNTLAELVRQHLRKKYGSL